jgi:hypothetical protein
MADADPDGHRATLVAKTSAKSASGVHGFCIAAIDEQTGKLVRLVAACGEAMPFWRPPDVVGLDAGMHILYQRCAWDPPACLDRYPHKTDDVACSKICIANSLGSVSLFNRLKPLANSSLQAIWPATVLTSHKAVKIDSKSASLAVVVGALTELTLLDQRNGHAKLHLQDGSSVHGIRVMCCLQLRELLRELPPPGQPLLRGCFILGLTRANADHPSSCGMLLVGCAPEGCAAVLPAATKQKKSRGQKRKR